MRILLVGGGAREHAIARALQRTPEVQLAVFSKSRNPGLEALAERRDHGDETDAKAVVAFAKKAKVDLATIGPEAPLAAGVSDALREAGIPVASPSRAAAEVETSKLFMRSLLARHKVPGSAGFEHCPDAATAKRRLKEGGLRFAIKPIGLTGGKGVQVFGDHFRTYAEGARYIDEVFAHMIGGSEGVLLEELLEGEEFTLQAFTDGSHVIPTIAVQDHKRLLPDDEGPNTGGMGSYSQADGLLPFLPRAAWEQAVETVRRIVAALKADGRPYAGPIYGQFMLTPQGPRVIEVNARLGDPEAMNVLTLLESDAVELFFAMSEGRLRNSTANFDPDATVVKYVVPPGYGTKPKAGVVLEFNEEALRKAGADLYFANVDAVAPGKVKTTTSRSLAVLGRGETIQEANERCEAGLRHVKGAGVLVRHDIGTRQLIDKRIHHMKQLVRAA